ncbi:MAG: serine/threonine-protein kinase [Polyangia bacterium]
MQADEAGGARGVLDSGPPWFVDEDGRSYLLQAEIGRGVLTSVGSAEARPTDGRYAIKTVLPMWVGHPLAEARIARERELSTAIHETSQHANCARILNGGRQSVGDGRSRPFHVSPLYDGITLSERLRTGHPHVGAQLALAWADDLLSALERLHCIGWLHRDVKPQNVFIIETADARLGEPPARPFAMLMDYGLAVRIDAARLEADEPFGTPAYVSPEVVAGATLDGRADLYSLGLILFELLCGRRPFIGGDPVSLIEAHLSEHPPSLRELCPGLSEELDHVLAATLAKSPGERPSSASELAAMLRLTPEGRRS